MGHHWLVWDGQARAGMALTVPTDGVLNSKTLFLRAIFCDHVIFRSFTNFFWSSTLKHHGLYFCNSLCLHLFILLNSVP